MVRTCICEKRDLHVHVGVQIADSATPFHQTRMTQTGPPTMSLYGT